MKARFDELLPFYVNGSLSEADRAWVEDYLRQNPDAAAELHWYESLQTKLREDLPPVSSEVGLDRAIQRIRKEGPVPQLPRRATGPSLAERLGNWLSALMPQPVLRPALAGLLAVVALQAVVIAQLSGDDEDASQLRAVRGSVIEKGPYVKVNFKPDAREADIRLLLVEVHGSLAAGPGQLGDYYVRVPEKQLAAVTDKLKASGIVEGFSVVDGLPARQ
jgi:hypothetical protein